jgi:restriction system protein
MEALARERSKPKLVLLIVFFGAVLFVCVYLDDQLPSWHRSLSIIGGLSGIYALIAFVSLVFQIVKDAKNMLTNRPAYCPKCHIRVDSQGAFCSRCVETARVEAAKAESIRAEQVRRAEQEEAERKRKLRTIEGLQQLSGKEFEDLIASLFRKDGYTVRQCGGSGDEGVDLILQISTAKDVVQCKRWKTDVGSPVVREFYGAVMHSNARHGFIITTAHFSSSARSFAAGKPITLISGSDVIRWIDNAYSARSSAENSARERARESKSSGAGSGLSDPYTVLGVERGANREEIRAAYHREMSKYHPDRVAGLGKELQDLAHIKAQAINRAYSELSGN